MAKAKSKKRPQIKARTQAESPPASATPPAFSFDGYNVLGVVFQLVPKAPLADDEQPPLSGYPIQLTVNATVRLSNERVGQLRLIMSAVPDPRVQPYRIVVDVIGTFSTTNGTAEQLGEFCRRVAPAILFPYIREIIDRTTTYAPFGPVRLAPTNINQVVNQTPWSDASKDVHPVTDPVSTEPAQR